MLWDRRSIPVPLRKAVSLMPYDLCEEVGVIGLVAMMDDVLDLVTGRKIGILLLVGPACRRFLNGK